MNIDEIRDRIHARLYGEEFTRGVMEFDWGRDSDPDKFTDRLQAAKDDCLKIGVRWIDADPMAARIVVITPKEQSQAVVDIMSKYDFTLINQIFNPQPVENLHGRDTP